MGTDAAEKENHMGKAVREEPPLARRCRAPARRLFSGRKMGMGTEIGVGNNSQVGLDEGSLGILKDLTRII